MKAPDSDPPREVASWAGAVVSGPVGTGGPDGWRVGEQHTPHAPDSAAVRTARLEARLAAYARYAAIVAEEAAAVVAGDDARRAALSTARDDAAEHFGELRTEAPGTEPGAPFEDVLTDACYELRFQDGVDRALKRRLGVLHDSTAAPPPLPLAAGTERRVPQLDLRF